jgi:hypothetical protein
MEGINLSEYLDNLREMEDSLSVSVKLGWREVNKLVVQDLIKKRNARTNKTKKEFDVVLLYYLGDEDFEKYVTNGKPID